MTNRELVLVVGAGSHGVDAIDQVDRAALHREGIMLVSRRFADLMVEVMSETFRPSRLGTSIAIPMPRDYCFDRYLAPEHHTNITPRRFAAGYHGDWKQRDKKRRK